MVSEEGYEEEWNEGDEWNGSWNDGYQATRPMIRTGVKAIGPMKICTSQMSVDCGYFQKKGKGKEKKGKKGQE